MGWSVSDVLTLVGAVVQSGLIEAAIRMIEGIFSKASGADKKVQVMKVVMEGLPEFSRPIVSAAVDAVVSEYNDKGVFKHSSSPASGGEGVPGMPSDNSGLGHLPT